MPSAKCGGCAKFLSPTEAARCAKCRVLYHKTCAAVNMKGGITSVWYCPDCKKTISQNSSSHSPSNRCTLALHTGESSSEEFLDTTPTKNVESNEGMSGIAKELRLFKEELRAELRSIRHEFQAFREECEQLRNSLNVCNERIDGLDKRLCTLEQKSPAYETEATVAQLRLELNDRDQEILSSDLEIANLPEIPGENIIHTVSVVAAKLGVTLEERDVVYAQRVGPPRTEREPGVGAGRGASAEGGAGAARGRRVVVRLARRALRDQLLQNARTRRGANTADLGFPGPIRRFFVNERLTKRNKQLFFRVREAGSRLGWRYMWTKFGRILAKKGDGEPTFCIRSEEDLCRIFGTENSTAKGQ